MRKECGNINVTESLLQPNIICTCTLNFKRTGGRTFSLGMSTRYSDKTSPPPQSAGWRDSNPLFKGTVLSLQTLGQTLQGLWPSGHSTKFEILTVLVVPGFLLLLFFFVQNPLEADGVGSIDAGWNRAMDRNELFHFFQVVGGRSDSLTPVLLSYAHHINTTTATVLSL